MLEESETRIPDIVKGCLKDGVRKKGANLGVMDSSSSKSKPVNSLYLQSLVGSIPVRVLVDCYTQGLVDVTLCLGSNLEFSVRLHIIEASSFDVDLGYGCFC